MDFSGCCCRVFGVDFSDQLLLGCYVSSVTLGSSFILMEGALRIFLIPPVWVRRRHFFDVAKFVNKVLTGFTFLQYFVLLVFIS